MLFKRHIKTTLAFIAYLIIWGLAINWFHSEVTRCGAANAGIFIYTTLSTLVATIVLVVFVNTSKGERSRDYLKFLLLFWAIPVVTYFWFGAIN
jgi:hypothetical protein